MANEVSLFKGGIPAYLKAQSLDEVTKALIGSGEQGRRISIRGSAFRMIVDGKEITVAEDRAMNVVIVNVASKVARTFYAGKFDPNVKTGPTCWSDNGDTPSAQSSELQSATCATCPQNVKGSNAAGTGRACRFNRHVAVVLDNDLNGDVYGMALPAESIFGSGEGGKLPLNAYAQFLAGFNVNVTAVVTEMRFDTDSSTPKLTFKAIRPLTEVEYNLCVERGQEKEAIDAVTVKYAPAHVTEEVAKPSPPKATKSKLAKVDDEVDDVPPAEEPKRRESKKDETPPKKNLAAVLDAWDDDEA